MKLQLLRLRRKSVTDIASLLPTPCVVFKNYWFKCGSELGFELASEHLRVLYPRTGTILICCCLFVCLSCPGGPATHSVLQAGLKLMETCLQSEYWFFVFVFFYCYLKPREHPSCHSQHPLYKCMNFLYFFGLYPTNIKLCGNHKFEEYIFPHKQLLREFG